HDPLRTGKASGQDLHGLPAQRPRTDRDRRLLASRTPRLPGRRAGELGGARRRHATRYVHDRSRAQRTRVDKSQDAAANAVKDSALNSAWDVADTGRKMPAGVRASNQQKMATSRTRRPLFFGPTYVDWNTRAILRKPCTAVRPWPTKQTLRRFARSRCPGLPDGCIVASAPRASPVRAIFYDSKPPPASQASPVILAAA